VHEFDPHTPSIARIYDYFLGGEDNSRSIVRWRRVAERQIAIAPLIPVSGALMKKHNALARRLRYRQHDYLRFTQDSRAPPDNNGTERDIRMAKLKQKVSGCLRTMTGVGQFCAIRSYLSTAAKHGLSFLDALAMLAEGEPWMPAAA
jgi:transposase